MLKLSRKKLKKTKKQTNKKGILLRASSHRQHNAGLIFEEEVGTTCSDQCTSHAGRWTLEWQQFPI